MPRLGVPAWICLGLGVVVQAQTPAPVRLERIQGVDTFSRLDPSWTAVEVIDNRPRPFRVALPGVDPVRREIDFYDTVAVVRIREVRGRRRSDSDWVDSVVEADMLDVLKRHPTRRFANGGRVTFVDTGGGTVTVGRTSVTIRMAGTDAYLPGAIYLVTLVDDGVEPISPGTSGYAVRDGVLQARDHQPDGGMRGRTLDDIRAAAARR
jgi:hypothetical protein